MNPAALEEIEIAPPDWGTVNVPDKTKIFINLPFKVALVLYQEIQIFDLIDSLRIGG